MHQYGIFPKTRLRRLRSSSAIRSLVRETKLTVDNLVLPLFIRHGTGAKKPIPSMPGHFQLTIEHLTEEINTITSLGIQSVLLFGIPAEKDPLGKDAYSSTGIIQTALPIIKKAAPNLLVISDVCFCEYTNHGHCGILNQQQTVDNDQTLALLVKQAISHANAGVDIIAPSGMIDGMVHTIREGLDNAGHHSIPILSYSVKYASSLYGPFRQAAEGSPRTGDRLSHQMDHANTEEALRECGLDITEGADMIMVKPAHTYLDIIFKVKQTYPHLPLGAYHTSGEFAMIKAAAEKGWVDEQTTALEILMSIRRAGADFIISYFAKEAAVWLKQ